MRFSRQNDAWGILYRSAVKIVHDSEKAGNRNAKALLCRLADEFSERTGTRAFVWADSEKGVVFPEKDSCDGEALRIDVEDDGREAGWLDGENAYFCKYGIGECRYTIAIGFKREDREEKDRVAGYAEEIFSLAAPGYRAMVSESHIHPSMLPDISYYHPRFKDYCGIAYLRPAGAADIAGSDYGGLVRLYRGWVARLKECDGSGAMSYAFDAGSLVVLLKDLPDAYGDFRTAVEQICRDSGSVDENIRVWGRHNDNGEPITYGDVIKYRLNALSKSNDGVIDMDYSIVGTETRPLGTPLKEDVENAFDGEAVNVHPEVSAPAEDGNPAQGKNVDDEVQNGGDDCAGEDSGDAELASLDSGDDSGLLPYMNESGDGYE